jgi:hypothetical protein
MRSLALSIGWALLLTLVISASWMPPKVSSPNERSRVYLAHALVVRGELQVTAEWQRWGRIFDIAHRDGQFYTDKAPGSSVLAAPVVAAYRVVNPAYTIEDLVLVCRRFVMLVFTFLAALATMRSLALLGSSRADQLLVSALLLWGSNVIHYGHAFFGHVIVMALVALSCWALLAAIARDGQRGEFALWAAGGLAAGAAFMVEYQAALVTIALLIGIVSDPAQRGIKRLAALCAGVAPLVLVTLAYNYAAFGSPLTTSYGFLYFEASKTLHSQGAWGVSLPTMESLSGILFTPSRGLLFSCPALLFGLSLWREDYREAPAWLMRASMLIIAAFCYVATSFGMWSAGWGQGPRIFIPALAPLALLLGVRLDTMSAHTRSCVLGLGVASICSNLLIKLTFAETAPEISAPLRDSALALLKAGVVSPSWSPSPWFIIALVAMTLGAGLVALHRRGEHTILWRAIAATIGAWLLLMWTQPARDAKQLNAHVNFVRSLIEPPPR